jgi:hypothetical protein
MEKKYKSLDMKINSLVRTQTNKPNSNAQFYHRVVNKTSISFIDDELTLLNKGFKYNLSYKLKQWLSNHALEDEAAIMFPTHEQEHIRYQVTHNLQRLYKRQNERPTVIYKTMKNENKTINHIKKKLVEEKAMITRTDKGNSIIIILYIDDYNYKIDTFVSNNNFTQPVTSPRSYKVT